MSIHQEIARRRRILLKHSPNISDLFLSLDFGSSELNVVSAFSTSLIGRVTQTILSKFWRNLESQLLWMHRGLILHWRNVLLSAD